MSLQFQFDTIEKELSGRFQDHIEWNARLVDAYNSLGFSDRACRVAFCGTELDFTVPIDFSDTPKLYRANFCRDRLCSMCGWRRSLKVFGQVSQIMDELEKQQYKFVFVTLTLKNCSGPRLKETVDELFYGFKKFMLIKDVKKAFLGGFRAVEVTRDLERGFKNEFHPHLHCVFAVNKNYFKASYYISQKKLAALWQQALGIDYQPIVDIRKINPEVDEEGVSFGKAVAEVSKYTVKTSDFLIGSDRQIEEGVWNLLLALSSRRLFSFYGVFRKVAQQLKLDDVCDGDLVHTDNEKVRNDIGHYIIKYKWQVGFGYQVEFVKFEEAGQNHVDE